MLAKLQSDLKDAMLQKDSVRVSTIRLLLSEIHNSEIAKGEPLADESIVTVIQKEAKKRKEAADGFRAGGREESAQKEEKEAEILMTYLPEQISDEELTKIVENAIESTGAKEISDMGKVIGMVLGQVNGQADGGRVSALVKQKLTNG